eukprot:1692850-Pleurochrysis_carterae.AAC.3
MGQDISTALFDAGAFQHVRAPLPPAGPSSAPAVQRWQWLYVRQQVERSASRDPGRSAAPRTIPRCVARFYAPLRYCNEYIRGVQ